MQEPRIHDFGWRDPDPRLGIEGRWTIDGGKEAYVAAFMAYKASQAETQSEPAHFKVDFNGVFQNLVDSYNKVVRLLSSSITEGYSVDVKDGYELECLLDDLRTTVLHVAAIQVDGSPSLVHSENFVLDAFYREEESEPYYEDEYDTNDNYTPDDQDDAVWAASGHE